MIDGVSRRRLLSGAAASGGLALLAGCGHAASPTAKLHQLPRAARSSEVEILDRLLGVERAGIAAYTAGIPLLSGRLRRTAEHFLTQELTHAGELGGLIHQARAKPPRPPASFALGHPRTPRDVLRLLHGFEAMQIAAYIDALPRLQIAPVRATLAAILACQGQHITILRAALGEPAVPAPLLSGHE